ncbi:MAG: PQQ-binding-like beta-propeller repeat protein [Myxococcota bacterium]
MPIAATPVATPGPSFADAPGMAPAQIGQPSSSGVDPGAPGSPTARAVSAAGAVLIHPGSDGKLRAVATLTGAELWTWDSGTTGALTSPVETPAGLLVGSSEGSVYLVDPKTGDELWRWHEPYLLRGVSAEPAVDGRQAVFVSNAGYLYSLIVPAPTPPRERAWP